MEEIKCSNCGAPIQEGDKFCTNCGTPVQAPVSIMERAAEPAAEIVLEEKKEMPSVSAMVTGIVGSAACWFPLGSIAGIILGAITLSKVKKMQAEYGRLDGKGIAAKVTGIVGLAGGITMLILWAIIFGCSIAAALIELRY